MSDRREFGQYTSHELSKELELHLLDVIDREAHIKVQYDKTLGKMVSSVEREPRDLLSDVAIFRDLYGERVVELALTHVENERRNVFGTLEQTEEEYKMTQKRERESHGYMTRRVLWFLRKVTFGRCKALYPALQEGECMEVMTNLMRAHANLELARDNLARKRHQPTEGEGE